MRFGQFRTVGKTAQFCFGLNYRSAMASYRPLACMVPFTRIAINPATGMLSSVSQSAASSLFGVSGDISQFEIEDEAEGDELFVSDESIEYRMNTSATLTNL